VYGGLGGRDVIHETQKTYSKPTLDADSFQRLLAAAYILQSRGERAPVLPISAIDTNSFIANAIVQKRIPSVRLSSTRSSALAEANLVHKFARVMVWNRMVWKRIDAFAIGIVLCTMMGMSIHHLLAFPGRTAPSTIGEPRDVSPLTTSTPEVLASSEQPAATPKPRQSRDDDADEFGEDVVIRYQAPTANRVGRPARVFPSKNTNSTQSLRIAVDNGAEMLSDAVVHYGDDVTMWSSRQSKKFALDRSGH
jgi:hypothetical protein